MSSLITPSIVASVNAGMATKTPRGLSGFNTREMDGSYFRGMLYGDTDSRKTTTAAMFKGPEKTLIINTRSAEQMLPLSGKGFRVAQVSDGEALAFALQFPDRVADAIGFPQWKDMEDRVLMADDMTRGSEFLVDDNEVDDKGKERKDGRLIYKAVNSDLRELMASLKRKKMHLLFTALAKITTSPIESLETIAPDMPAGARSILTADLEYVFFLKKSNPKMLTAMSYLNFTKKDENGKAVLGKREIFGKNKLPLELIGLQPPVLKLEEDLDLASLWFRIQQAKTTLKGDK